MAVRTKLVELSKNLGETYSIVFNPILRFTGLPVSVNLLLSYMIGWNENNKPMVVTKKLHSLCGIPKDKMDIIIKTLLANKLIISNEIIYSNNAKGVGYSIHENNLIKLIESNDNYKALTKKSLDYVLDDLNKILNDN
jgi:hypothetical protein